MTEPQTNSPRADDQLARWTGRAGSFPNTMVVVAHPDDETIGAASRLPNLNHATFIYTTDGAPREMADALAAGCATREAYAHMRGCELRTVLEMAAAREARVTSLHCVDQEASYHLPTLATVIAREIEARSPEVIATHPYEGGHPDHDASAFAVHAACRLIQRSGAVPPVIIEMTSYHAHEAAWQFGTFLPFADRVATTICLAPAQQAWKRTLLGAFASQAATLRNVPVELERFRVAPNYDFTAAPHDGALLYESYAWGMKGREWRQLARNALGELNLDMEHPEAELAGATTAVPCR